MARLAAGFWLGVGVMCCSLPAVGVGGGEFEKEVINMYLVEAALIYNASQTYPVAVDLRQAGTLMLSHGERVASERDMIPALWYQTVVIHYNDATQDEIKYWVWDKANKQHRQEAHDNLDKIMALYQSELPTWAYMNNC